MIDVHLNCLLWNTEKEVQYMLQEIENKRMTNDKKSLAIKVKKVIFLLNLIACNSLRSLYFFVFSIKI